MRIVGVGVEESESCGEATVRGQGGPCAGSVTTWLNLAWVAIVGAVFGCGIGFLVWIVFRWLGFFQDIEWFIKVVYPFPVEYFICGGALLCAGIASLISWVWK